MNKYLNTIRTFGVAIRGPAPFMPMPILACDRPGAKYQPVPGDHFLAGAGVLFSAGAGDLWFFSPTIFEII